MKMAKWILTLQWQDDLWDVSKQEEMRTKKILRDKQSMKTWIDTQRYERIWRYNSTTGSLCNPKVGRISFCFSPLSLLPSLRLVSKFCGFFYISLVSVFFFLTFYKYAVGALAPSEMSQMLLVGVLHWEARGCDQMPLATENVSSPFSLLPPLLSSHPNPPLIYIYCIWFLISILLSYFIWSWVDLASHRQDLLWCGSLTWRDMTGRDRTWHDMTWQSTFES